MYRVILVVESVILLLYAAVCMNGCMDIENKLLIRAICRLVIIELQAPHRSGERATITAMSSESYCLCYPALSNIIRSYCSIPSCDGDSSVRRGMARNASAVAVASLSVFVDCHGLRLLVLLCFILTAMM